jgi:hypothetical protein
VGSASVKVTRVHASMYGTIAVRRPRLGSGRGVEPMHWL